MNPDLQKQLAEMLAKLTDVAGDATKWAGSQIPPLVQEKIALGRATTTFWMLLGVIVAPVAFRYSVSQFQLSADISKKRDERYHRNEQIISFLRAVVTCWIGLAGIFTALDSVNEFLLVWFAPRLYIVEWLRGMIR